MQSTQVAFSVTAMCMLCWGLQGCEGQCQGCATLSRCIALCLPSCLFASALQPPVTQHVLDLVLAQVQSPKAKVCPVIQTLVC